MQAAAAMCTGQPQAGKSVAHCSNQNAAPRKQPLQFMGQVAAVSQGHVSESSAPGLSGSRPWATSPLLSDPLSLSCLQNLLLVLTKSCLTLCNPMEAARQASLSFTISHSMLKLMSIESVMSSNHLILCHPLLLLPSIFPSIRVFPIEASIRELFYILLRQPIPLQLLGYTTARIHSHHILRCTVSCRNPSMFLIPLLYSKVNRLCVYIYIHACILSYLSCVRLF